LRPFGGSNLDNAKLHAKRARFLPELAAMRSPTKLGSRAGLPLLPRIVNLVGRFPRERVEAVCERALSVGTRSFSSVKSILDGKLDRKTANGPRKPRTNRRSFTTTSAYLSAHLSPGGYQAARGQMERKWSTSQYRGLLPP